MALLIWWEAHYSSLTPNMMVIRLIILIKLALNREASPLRSSMMVSAWLMVPDRVDIISSIKTSSWPSESPKPGVSTILTKSENQRTRNQTHREVLPFPQPRAIPICGGFGAGVHAVAHLQTKVFSFLLSTPPPPHIHVETSC